MKTINKTTMITFIGALSLFAASAEASPEHCTAWKTAPATTACKGEGGTLAAGSYVKNGNGLWQCREGEKDQWGHTVTWVADKAQLDNDCIVKGVNIAPLGEATQSTTGWNGVASRAIDGNTNGVYSGAHGSVTHTNGPNSWWQVALDAKFQINDIRIYNRTGTTSDRLDQFSVEILEDGQVVKSFGPYQAFSADYFDVPGVNGATGNKVRISIPGHYLSLAEVEVYGELAKGAQADAAQAGSGGNINNQCETAVTCGDGTTLVDGVCTLSPKSCPELTEWHPTLNACQSTVNGVCSVETAYRPKDDVISWYYFFGDTVGDPAYGELVSGTRGGHCLDQDGGHCSASVRSACDTIRRFDQQGLTDGVAGEDLCTTVSPGGGFSFVRGYGYQAFFDACGTLFNAGMRVEQRHGI